MQLKMFATIHLPVGVMIISLILISQILTAESAELIDKEDDEDKAIKQKLVSSETNLNEDNIRKQEEEATEEQESNDDTSERESEDNVMIDDDGDRDDNINPSEDDDDDDVPFELPFDNIIPFP